MYSSNSCELLFVVYWCRHRQYVIHSQYSMLLSIAYNSDLSSVNKTSKHLHTLHITCTHSMYVVTYLPVFFSNVFSCCCHLYITVFQLIRLVSTSIYSGHLIKSPSFNTLWLILWMLTSCSMCSSWAHLQLYCVLFKARHSQHGTHS